jgi:hypothetical protein
MNVENAPQIITFINEFSRVISPNLNTSKLNIKEKLKMFTIL